MTALAALLERPVIEIAFGVVALGSACVLGAVAFFSVGFRIAGVPAWEGFESLLGLGEGSANNARAVPQEVADRLRAIKESGSAVAERASLDELAHATASSRPSGLPTSKAKAASAQRRS